MGTVLEGFGRPPGDGFVNEIDFQNMKHKKELLKHRLKHFKKLFLEINKRIGVTRKLNVAL